MRRREGKGRCYQGSETGGKPSAAAIQMEQTEGNSSTHTAHHVTTEKNICNIFFKDIRFSVDFPLDNLFIFKTKRVFIPLFFFPFLPSF